ncbi:MAG TPA: hypothetical protein VJ343_03280 [archaeon]|nr:hypothetical protein [archaeon]
MKVNVGHTPDIARVNNTPYHQEILDYLKEFDNAIERVNILELAGYLEMRVIFSEKKHEDCYKAMKSLVEKAKMMASKYDLKLKFVPLNWYDEGRLQIGPVLHVGKVHCVFMPPESGSPYIFRPRDHEKLLKKYNLPTEESVILKD